MFIIIIIIHIITCHVTTVIIKFKNEATRFATTYFRNHLSRLVYEQSTLIFIQALRCTVLCHSLIMFHLQRASLSVTTLDIGMSRFCPKAV